MFRRAEVLGTVLSVLYYGTERQERHIVMLSIITAVVIFIHNQTSYQLSASLSNEMKFVYIPNVYAVCSSSKVHYIHFLSTVQYPAQDPINFLPFISFFNKKFSKNPIRTPHPRFLPLSQSIPSVSFLLGNSVALS